MSAVKQPGAQYRIKKKDIQVRSFPLKKDVTNVHFCIDTDTTVSWYPTLALPANLEPRLQVKEVCPSASAANSTVKSKIQVIQLDGFAGIICSKNSVSGSWPTLLLIITKQNTSQLPLHSRES